jgi:hypothetical protein
MRTISAYKPVIILFSLIFCPGTICALGVLSGSEIGENIALIAMCSMPVFVLAAIWYGIRRFG